MVLHSYLNCILTNHVHSSIKMEQSNCFSKERMNYMSFPSSAKECSAVIAVIIDT